MDTTRRLPRVASIQRIAAKVFSRKPIFSPVDRYALGPGLWA